MSAPPQLSARALRTATVKALDRLAEWCAELGLSAPPEVLAQLRTKLVEDAYRVLVVGEAKRGKSTFINALLGATILPRDLEVATSQVFRVRDAEREAYRLRFEDGTAREIERADLARYGSQVAADAGEGGAVERPLRWIEADVPARFLPAQVELMDTPGLGALHAAHAQITRRFVPQADAVILALDSSRPMGDTEADLLAAVLDVTTRVFFVQTKIDQHSREVWEQTQQRNEEILHERFGDRLGEPRVWPLSSTNLLAAAAGKDAEALIFVSRYPDLAEALRTFLEEVCATPRAAEALAIASRHHNASRQVLESRLRSLNELSQRDAEAHRQAIAQRRDAFRAAWGERGRERVALRQALKRSSDLSKKTFREALRPGGSVAAVLQERLDAVQSPADANRLGEELAGQVIAVAMDEWARVCAASRRHYAEILEPFLRSSEELMPDVSIDEVTLRPAESRFAPTEDHIYDRVRGSVGYSMPVWAASSIAISIVATPLMLAAVAGGVVWALNRGWKVSSDAKGKVARNELQRHLDQTLQHVQRHFFAVDVTVGRSSRVDEYFDAVAAALEERIDAVVEQRVAETQREIATLQAQASLRADERETEAQVLRAALEEWEDLANEIARLLGDDRARAHLGALARRH